MATDLGAIQDAAAQSWGIDPTYFKAIGSVESGNTINSPDSPTGAVGPMQVEPATAAGLGVTDIRDPVQNVYASAKYLSQQLDKYKDPNLAAAAYNAGPGRVDAYLADPTGSPLPDQTLAYVPKVAAAYQQFAAPSGGASSAPAGAAPVQVAEADAGIRSDASPAPSASSSSPADPFSDLMSAAQAHAGGPVGSGSSAASSPVPAGVSAAGSSGQTSGSADPFSSLMSAASAHASAPPAGGSGSTTIPVVPAGSASSSATGATSSPCRPASCPPGGRPRRSRSRRRGRGTRAS